MANVRELCFTAFAGLCILLALPPAATMAQEADPEARLPPAALTFSFTNNGEPLPDPTLVKFFIYEPEEREHYVTWGHGAQSAYFPGGVYDLIIRYENDAIVQEVERLEIELTGDIEEAYDFSVPVARLNIDVTSRGIPIPTFSGTYSLHKSGTRGKPLARKRPGETVTIRPGLYDIEVTYRGDQGLQTRWLEGYRLVDLHYEAVDFDSPAAQVRFTLRDGYRRVPAHEGVWRVYRHRQHQQPLAEQQSGESLEVETGVYDVGLFLDRDGVVVEHWLIGIRLRGEIDREIDMSEPQTSLRVTMTYEGLSQEAGWYSVFPAGRRNAPILSAKSGTTVVLEPGAYDIRCLAGQEGRPTEKWVYGQTLRDPFELHVELGTLGGTPGPGPIIP